MEFPTGKLTLILSDLLYAKPWTNFNRINGDFSGVQQFEKRIRKIGG
jgi:hypothetical protein